MLSLNRCASPTAYSSPLRTPPSPPAVPPRRLFETQSHPAVRLTLTRDWNLSAVYPAPSGRSQLHRAHRRRCARHRRILHVTPKATKVKAAGDRLDCVRVMAQHQVLAHRVHNDVEDPRCACGEPQADRVRVQLDRAQLGRRDSAACTPVRTLGGRRRRSRYLVPTFFTTPCPPPRLRRSTASSPSPLPAPSFAYTSSFSNVPGTPLSITGAAQLTWATSTLEAYSHHLRQRLPHRIYRLLWHQLEGEFRGGADGCVEQG
ncbi:hypothetical protein C8R44DRAFT_410442 [Mycena epipterygia]|nr:hypothetical protein C8R44DRAFT_410442 [Mycena epipterygia]